MKTRGLALGVVVIVAGCMWSRSPRPVPVEDDRSIVFPSFFDRAADKVGAGEALHELDGVVLRAVMIAANDLLPPGDESQPCWDRQEAYRYRVVRQGEVIFVRIIEDLEYCGSQYISVDTGAKYAISTDGRILRRIIGAEPERAENQRGPDAGDKGNSPEQRDGGISPGPFEPIPTPSPAPDAG